VWENREVVENKHGRVSTKDIFGMCGLLLCAVAAPMSGSPSSAETQKISKLIAGVRTISAAVAGVTCVESRTVFDVRTALILSALLVYYGVDAALTFANRKLDF
jgi:hypothetical protein